MNFLYDDFIFLKTPTTKITQFMGYLSQAYSLIVQDYRSMCDNYISTNMLNAKLICNLSYEFKIYSEIFTSFNKGYDNFLIEICTHMRRYKGINFMT